jgi:hypothetical protein
MVKYTHIKYYEYIHFSIEYPWQEYVHILGFCVLIFKWPLVLVYTFIHIF